MSTALATLAPAQIESAVSGSGIGLQTLDGCVSAFFALEAYDRRSGAATYALRVVNRTTSALICRTWVVSRSGDALLAHPILVEIAPLSTSLARVPVWPSDFPSFDRAIAEIAGEGVHCIVEAPAPAHPKRRRMLAIVATAGTIAGGMLLACAAAVNAALPRITAFAMAPETLAGSTVRAEYAVSGSGQLHYSVLAPDGRQIQSGRLSSRAGDIPVAVPASDVSGAYTVQLAMDGVFGKTASTRVLNATVARPATVAAIDAISVKPAVAKPGDTVSVAYSAAGDTGYVRLVGSDGTIWQQRPFSRAGAAQFVVPPVRALREMRVLIQVKKGQSVAQSMAGFAVVSDSTTANAATSQVVGGDDPDQAAQPGTANGTFELVERAVKSGASIHVRIISPRNGMRIALTDEQSHEVTGIDVQPDATSATLTAPVVYKPTPYTVVATFTDGFGEESVVEPVTVEP